jgi:DNA primase
VTIPQEAIEEVRRRADLTQVVGRHVALKQAGRSLKGLCPFHGEKTPSFHVNPERGFYHCFGCGAGGDAIKFVMAMEAKAFPEAVRALAAEFGVPIPERDEDPQAAALRKRRQQIVDLQEVAAKFFEKLLWESREGEPARKHILGRGLDEATARAWRLGWGGAGWSELADHLAQKGPGSFDGRLAEEAGLLVARKSGGFFDRFRGRIMIPIHAPDGRLVAFGGRWLEGATPPDRNVEREHAKFINSPESPVYEKGRLLYGLPQAREEIRKSGTALIVEGYFDVIALHRAGVKGAVATCGTALTPAHGELLARSGCKDVAMVFDGDEAGVRAAVRGAEVLAASLLPARVVVLPEGQDPDDAVEREGKDAFGKRVADAPGAVDWLIDRALAGRAGSVEDRVRAVDAVKPVLLAMPPGLQRNLYAKRVAERVGADDKSVLAMIHGGTKPGTRTGFRPAPGAAVPTASPPGRRPEHVPGALSKADVAARRIAVAALVRPELAVDVEQQGGLQQLGHPDLERALARLATEFRETGAADVAGALAEVSDEELVQQLRAAVMRADAEAPADRAQLGRAVEKLKDLRRREDSLRRARAMKETQGTDPEAARRMLEEARALSRR